MVFSKKAICVAALSTLATVCSAGSAHAITFDLDRGLYGPGGSTAAQGAFSDFYQDPNTRTIDFNDGKVPTSGFATYSFAHDQSGWQSTPGASKSSVRNDMWAPANPDGTDNKSNYLEVFTGDAVTITLQQTLNAFGIDWGAISADNTFSFYREDGTLVKKFTSADVEPIAEKYGVTNTAQKQSNGYLYFYSEGNNDNFKKIVISQGSIAGGGFESDNHSFHIGTGKYVAAPEPSSILGVLGTGVVGAASFLTRRGKKKSVLQSS